MGRVVTSKWRDRCDTPPEAASKDLDPERDKPVFLGLPPTVKMIIQDRDADRVTLSAENAKLLGLHKWCDKSIPVSAVFSLCFPTS